MDTTHTKGSGKAGSVKTLTVDMDKIQAALSELSSDNEVEGFTTEDLAINMSISMKGANDKIRTLIRQGKVKHVGFREATNVMGHRCRPKPVYQVI